MPWKPGEICEGEPDILAESSQCPLSAAWKQAGTFCAKGNLPHSHLGPLTEIFKMENKHGSPSKSRS